MKETSKKHEIISCRQSSGASGLTYAIVHKIKKTRILEMYW